MSRSVKLGAIGLLVLVLMAFGFAAFSQAETISAMSVYMPAIFKNSGGSPPTQYDLVCNPVYEINIVDEEVHFQFSATAYADGNPLEDVDLRGTLEVGASTPTTNIEKTNFNGVADFTITVLVGTISQTPMATVRFENQGTYGSDSCTINFSQTPPDPTPTPPPNTGFDLVCDQDYSIRIIDEEIDFEFAATAYNNSVPLEDVDLLGTVNLGTVNPSNVENTNFNGVADFNISTLIIYITHTPFATVEFNDQGTYGTASCKITFSGETLDLLLAQIR